MKPKGFASNAQSSVLAASPDMTQHCAGTPSILLLLALAIALCAPAARADILTVHVEDGQNGQLLEGAFVMVGLMAGTPFQGNFGWTDASGTIEFDDPSLGDPQTVTAAMEGFAHTTLYEAALNEITLPLYPPVVDSTMGGTITRVEGDVLNISTTSNDGNFDIALIIPAIAISDFVLMDRLPFSCGMEMVDFPIIGEIEMPENSYMPDQIEFLFYHFEKSPYRIDVPGLRETTFSSVSGRISIEALLSGAGLDDVEIREVGVERDVYVGAPMGLDIDSDLTLSPSLTVVFEGVPEGSDILIASGALIPSGGGEAVVTYDIRGASIDSASTFQMATRPPGGDLSDAVNVALGGYTDSSSARTFGSGILDRDGFQPPHTVVLDSWMNPPDLEQSGRDLSWSDPTQPGVSPSPTWTRSALGLRPLDPENDELPVSVTWRVYARAEPRNLTMPVLPAEAPGPPGGLPDPEQTPEEDQLYWALWAANPPDDAQMAVRSFLEGATHWTTRWTALEFYYADAPGGSEAGYGPAEVRACILRAFPNPGGDAILLSWNSSLGGTGLLQIVGVNGRLILRREVELPRSTLRWDGRCAAGDRVPAGIYWATLQCCGSVLDRVPIVWMR